MPQFATIHEFAELVGQHPESIRRKVRLGQLPAIDVSPSNARALYRIDVDAALRRLQVSTGEQRADA